MSNIHPTSVVDRGAELADDVAVGPMCYIGPNVVIGSGTRLISHVCVIGPTEIGLNNTIWPQVTLGGDPQDLKYDGEPTRLVIGDNNDLREGVTCHRGTKNDNGITVVGSHNLIMAYSHVAHDCVVGDHVTMANSVELAGHVAIEDHAVMVGAIGAHPFVPIGQYSYVGGMTRLVHDVPPYMIVEGNPSTVRGVNFIGLARHGFEARTIERLKNAYKRLFRNIAEGTGVGNVVKGLQELEEEYPDDQTIAYLVAAVGNTCSSTHGRYREAQRKDDRRRTQPK